MKLHLGEKSKTQFKLEELGQEFIVSLRKAYGSAPTIHMRLPVELGQKWFSIEKA